MTPHTANMINAIVLVLCSVWAYLTPEFSYWTALVPAGVGLALLVCNPGVKAQNKVIAHIAVTLTLAIFLLLLVPFFKAMGEGNVMSILRVGLMLATCILAKVAFIKSFRDARRARESASG
ncbi:MAG: hypothetical protein AAF280_13095 [Pseudomonadota bacterium]